MNLNRQLIQDIALLVARLAMAWTMIAHGWQKFFDYGLEGTAAYMGEAGVPVPALSATFAATVELGGGILLLAGVATRLASLGMIAVMAGAYLFAQDSSTIYMEADGYGYVLAVAACSLLLVAIGSGRFGADHLIAKRFLKESRNEDSSAAVSR